MTGAGLQTCFVANCRKLTQQQRDLILEYAKTEQLDNGTVNGLEQGLVCGVVV